MTTDSSQQGLFALFASRTLADLLRVLLLYPEHEFYQRQLQRLTGAHLRQLQRDLARLEQSGLVVKHASGNRSYYRAERSHPAFADLRQVIVKTVGLGDTLRSALSGLADGIVAAFIFGSFARGDDTAASDVDLLVIGTAPRRELAGALASPAGHLGREVNLALYTPAEFSTRLRAANHFITAVLAEPRIWLIGDEQALTALG